MRLFLPVLLIAVAACGSPRSTAEFAPQSVPQKKPVILVATSQLQVSRATVGTLISGDSPGEACGGHLLLSENGDITLALENEVEGAPDGAIVIEEGEAIWIPAYARWSAVNNHQGVLRAVNVLHAKVSATHVDCPKAKQVWFVPHSRSDLVWHDNAGGKLGVRVLLGGQGVEQMPISLAELRGQAGFSVPPHVHDKSDENLWIKKGVGIMRVGDSVIDIRGNQWVHVPKGVEHSFESDGSEPLIALQMYVPSGPEQRFIKSAR